MDTTLCNDFVSLPIIISDYDALVAKTAATGASSTRATTTSSSATTTTLTSSASAATQWTTGFADFADGIWSMMNEGLKRKLREACVEVLKRTDDASEEEKIAWVYDEDARFLD